MSVVPLFWSGFGRESEPESARLTVFPLVRKSPTRWKDSSVIFEPRVWRRKAPCPHASKVFFLLFFFKLEARAQSLSCAILWHDKNLSCNNGHLLSSLTLKSARVTHLSKCSGSSRFGEAPIRYVETLCVRAKRGIR